MNLRHKKIGILSIIVLVIGSCYFIYNNVDLRSKIFRSFAKGNWYITSAGDTLYTAGFYGIRMYDISDADNPVFIRENDEFCKKRNVGRGIEVNGNFIYVTSRFYMGYTEEVSHPDVKLQFEDSILSISAYNKGQFDYIYATEGAGADQIGVPSCNYGTRSLRLYTSGDKSTVLLSKSLSGNVSKGSLSFWFRIDYSLNDQVSIPILGKDNVSLYELGFAPDGTNYVVVDTENNRSEELLYGHWYQLKIRVTTAGVYSYLRSKECGVWSQLFIDNSINTNYNCLQIGLVSNNKDTVMIDDYYYSTDCDIDNVSYINGSLQVINRHDLSIVNSYVSDIKMVEVKKYKMHLYVSCLYGFNIYEISNPIEPKLIFTYRHPEWREFQGFDFFTNADHDYVMFSLFGEGVQIWDITTPSVPMLVSTISLQQQCTDGVVLPIGIQTFDVIVKYPYAYSVVGPMVMFFATDNDRRGLLVYDLHNLNEIKQTYIEIPKSEWYDKRSSDRAPTAIEIYNNKIYTNFAEKGMAIFDLTNPELPVFEAVQRIGGNGLIQPIHITKGHIYAGSYYWRTLYNRKI